MPAYMTGFGNEFASEALPGALPDGQNSPQRCPYGLYAEQLSGSAFTAPRALNWRSWLYRIRPSVLHARRFSPVAHRHWRSSPEFEAGGAVGPLRWGPPRIPSERLTFIEGVRSMTVAGDVHMRCGMSANLYFATASMEDEYFYDADGELLIVPQQGGLAIFTEFGSLDIVPGEIAVIPSGVKFKVALHDEPSRGYVCENFGSPFVLPNLGVVGANGLASPRDFQTPVAAFEDKETPCRLTVKWGGAFNVCEIGHSPLDVVAWHGNYAPYKYDLRKFVPVGSVLIDHPDPSIFTVLTSPSMEAGTGAVDFVIFPPRWQVAEHTFRPPWFHMNVMSEFMGLIFGRYDAKGEGFEPGGASLHNRFLPHGPDAAAFEQAAQAELKPQKLDDTLAFMFETRIAQHPTRYALALDTLQQEYAECWSGLPKRFDGKL